MFATTTGYDIASDAIKIGLGGLITGLFGYFIASLNSKSAIAKFHFEHRVKLLSEAAASTELLFQAFVKVSNHAMGVAGMQNTPVAAGLEIVRSAMVGDEYKKVIQLRMDMMGEPVQKALFAQAQLLLVGEKKAEEALNELYAAIMAADASYQFTGDSFTVKDAPANVLKVRDARKRYFAALAEAFKKGM